MYQRSRVTAWLSPGLLGAALTLSFIAHAEQNRTGSTERVRESSVSARGRTSSATGETQERVNKVEATEDAPPPTSEGAVDGPREPAERGGSSDEGGAAGPNPETSASTEPDLTTASESDDAETSVEEPTPPAEVPPAPGAAPSSSPSAAGAAPPSEAPTEVVEVVGSTGRWVYTIDYGWIWVPNGVVVNRVGTVSYVYLYTPYYGWSWYVSPWGPGLYYFGSWAWRAPIGVRFWVHRTPAPDRFVRRVRGGFVHPRPLAAHRATASPNSGYRSRAHDARASRRPEGHRSPSGHAGSSTPDRRHGTAPAPSHSDARRHAVHHPDPRHPGSSHPAPTTPRPPSSGRAHPVAPRHDAPRPVRHEAPRPVRHDPPRPARHDPPRTEHRGHSGSFGGGQPRFHGGAASGSHGHRR